MDEDKPYSLGWWLAQLVIAEHNRTKATQPKIDTERFTRYGLLTYWITRRIVRNFARRNRPQPSAPGSWRKAAGVLWGKIERGPDGIWRPVTK
jgi:hypothetical protein